MIYALDEQIIILLVARIQVLLVAALYFNNNDLYQIAFIKGFAYIGRNVIIFILHTKLFIYSIMHFTPLLGNQTKTV